MPRVRVDALLAERGLYASRSRAAAAVLAGDVLLGRGRRPAAKPGQLVDDDVEVALRSRPPFVSRGGVKLANALEALGLDVAGRRALDVGASTGGFTDCLLQRGAAAVIAADVAYGELHGSLRGDPRVTVLERVNARALDPAGLPVAPDLVVADVSFISLTKVLPAVLACCAPRFDALVMVKPQFEVGRERVGKGGVVRSPALRREAIEAVAACVVACGATVLAAASSGLPGPKGNRETFLWLAEGGRDDALGVEEVAAAALAAEPDEGEFPADDPAPGREERAPGREDRAPRLEHPASRWEDPASRWEDPAPRREDRAPRWEHPAPRWEDPAPRREDRAPRWEDPAPRWDGRAPRRDDPGAAGHADLVPEGDGAALAGRGVLAPRCDGAAAQVPEGNERVRPVEDRG